MIKSRALLVIAMIGCGLCFGAPAQELGNSQVSSLEDCYLASERDRRLLELPDQDFKIKESFGPVYEPREFELNVPWSDEEIRDSPFEGIISLWFETARAHSRWSFQLAIRKMPTNGW